MVPGYHSSVIGCLQVDSPGALQQTIHGSPLTYQYCLLTRSAVRFAEALLACRAVRRFWGARPCIHNALSGHLQRGVVVARAPLPADLQRCHALPEVLQQLRSTRQLLRPPCPISSQCEPC